MQSILDAMDSMGLKLSDPVAQEHARLLQTLSRDVSASQFDDRLKNAITSLYEETAVQAAIVRRNEYQLNDRSAYSLLYLICSHICDSALYFFDSVGRFVDTPTYTYIPSDMDIVKSRVKTTGIVEVFFPDVGGLPIRVLDVGGQRSERKKWSVVASLLAKLR